MKKVLVLVLAMLMICAAFVGCAAPAAEEPVAEEPAVEEPVAEEPSAEASAEAPSDEDAIDASGLKVALFLKNQINAVFLECQYGAEACAEEMGFTLDTMAPTTAGSSDEQNDLIISAISAGYDAFVISPCDSVAVCSAIDMAREAGIKVIIVADNVTSTEIDGTVIVDNKKAAATSFRKLCESLEGKGDVVVLRGSLANTVADQHIEGVNEVLADFPEVKILDIQPGDYVRTTANTVMEDYLQAYDNIDGLWAANDEMAVGAIEAIKAAGKDGIAVTSLDASTDGCQAMKNGDILFDIDKNWSGVGYYGAMNAVYAVLNKDYEKDCEVEVIEVTMDNVDEIIAKKS